MDKYILPIACLILSAITLASIIRESFEREKLSKFKFVVVSIITFFIVLVIAFVDRILENANIIIIYIIPILIVVLGLIMFNSIYVSILSKKINSSFMDIIDDEFYYAYLNKQNKIVSISGGFSKFLKKEAKELKRQDFMTVFNDEYTNIYINGESVNNIEKVFNNISKSTKELHYEIKCLDSNGLSTILNLIDKPIYQSDNYKGHILYGNSLDHKEINRAEETINEKNDKLEMNKLRFVTLLEKGTDSAYFYNINSQSIWANDALVDSLKFAGNSISIEDFERRIHPDDLTHVREIKAKLNPNNPNYDIKYRFRDGLDYVYIHETGKKIYASETEIVAVVTKSNDIYSKTGINILDKCSNFNDLAQSVKALGEAPFEFVLVNFDNIKDINETYSRMTGSQVMADYILEFARAFIDNSKIYRLDGLVFGFIVTDRKKMIHLKQSLDKGMLTHASCTYSGVKIIVNTYIGIVSNKLIKDPNILLKSAKNAINRAKNDGKCYNYYEG